MEQTIAFLGRTPIVSLAELESLLGSSAIEQTTTEYAVLNHAANNVPYARLGGTSKLASLLETVNTTNISQLEKLLVALLPSFCADLPDGKVTLGVSFYGYSIGAKQQQKFGLTLKKAVTKSGRSVRLVPNKQSSLSDAQVLHNKLASGTNPKGVELCLIRSGNQTLIARTTNVQDIEAYAARDRNRPARDAKVGMLPPKLAQIIINLATGAGYPPNEPGGNVVLDPFCGTGVLLQEAALMGYYPYGTDLEPRMIEYTAKNYEWLAKKYDLPKESIRLEVGNATSHRWQEKTVIACEAYLGEPYFKLPTHQDLERNVSSTNKLLSDFLTNVANQTQPGFRLCVAVPAWATKDGSFKHLPMLDSLEEIGYNRVVFASTNNQSLIYHRPGQVVARELLVLERI